MTDVTNASRTSLFNIRTLTWDPELCALFRIPSSVLPEVCSSAEVVGHTRGVGFLPDGIPISGIAGDQQAALFGHRCFELGDTKCTYGTGAFLMMNTGHNPTFSRSGLLTTVAWKIGDQITYALEGSSFIAGAAVQWLRDGLGIIKNAQEIEELARKVPNSGEVMFVPALTGLGAPYWEPDARGLLCGIGRDTQAAHIARATLDGIAFQVTDLVSAMSKDIGVSRISMRVDGGASANDLLMQIQANVSGASILRPDGVERTALGAALLAGIGIGFFKTLDSLKDSYQIERHFHPTIAKEERDKIHGLWHKAVERTRL